VGTRHLQCRQGFRGYRAQQELHRAAEELSVTAGAVSQQVKALETELGLKLFNRERQRLMITEAGRD
jgi:LysR family glycine cleavage system transcriptional activator